MPNVLCANLSVKHVPLATGLIIQDLSTYPTVANNPRLSITLPQAHEAVVLPFTPGELNEFTAVDLGHALPDGLYQLRYDITGCYTCVTFFRTEQAECRLYTWMNQQDWLQEPVNGPAYQLLTQVSALLLGARAIVTLEPARAADYYQTAVSLLP